MRNLLQPLVNQGLYPWEIEEHWRNDADAFLEYGLDQEEVAMLKRFLVDEVVIASLYEGNFPPLTDTMKAAIERGLDEFAPWKLISNWEKGVLDHEYDYHFCDYQKELPEKYTKNDALIKTYKYAAEHEYSNY